MRPEHRIVTKLPLTELWNEGGALHYKRIRHLDQDLIRELMRNGPVQFVVADCGKALNWVSPQQRFEFWKSVRSQVADFRKPINLDEFLNRIAYIASEWRGPLGNSLILLESHH